MVHLRAREEQLRKRLAELGARLHRIDDHLGQPPDPDWGRTMRSKRRWMKSSRGSDMRAMLRYRRSIRRSRVSRAEPTAFARAVELIYPKSALISCRIRHCVGPARARSRRRGSAACKYASGDCYRIVGQLNSKSERGRDLGSTIAPTLLARADEVIE